MSAEGVLKGGTVMKIYGFYQISGGLK